MFKQTVLSPHEDIYKNLDLMNLENALRPLNGLGKKLIKYFGGEENETRKEKKPDKDKRGRCKEEK